MKQRFERIFSVIPECSTFADVGCDHGIISFEMLKKSKCAKLYYGDVSAPSLKKAEKLLSRFGEKAVGIHCDGLKNFPPCDCVLIAGMGGENIIDIIDCAPFYPQTFVLQPMKNGDKVRRKLLEKGYFLSRDFKFFAENRYYDLMVAQKGEGVLTEEETLYGKDNVNFPSDDFLGFLKEEIAEKERISTLLTENKREEYLKKLEEEKELYERLRIKRQA